MKNPLILIRHGQSQWNLENRFTGWVDVDLSAKGVEEAKKAGENLKKMNLKIEHVFTSTLKRAIKTADYVLDELKLNLTPSRDWRLNERHYGALQGKNKDETRQEFGEEQVQIWRRSFDTPPPFLKESDNAQGILGESLAMTCERVLPCWQELIAPKLKAQHVLIVAHGNSLRALMKMLYNISNDDILELEIPTGTPILCELSSDLKGIDYKFCE